MPSKARLAAQTGVLKATGISAKHKAPVVEKKQHKLRQQQKWRVLDMMLSSSADFAYAFDRDGRFLYANQPLLNLWGLALEDVVGRNFFDLKYPADLATRLHQQIQEVFATGKQIADVTPYTSPAGVQGFYEYIFSGVIGAGGAVELVAGATRDITVRKNEDEHLVQMEARYRGLLEAAPDAMVVVDQDGEIVLLNVQAENQFGYWRDELIGQKVKCIIPEGFAERLIADGSRTAAEALAQQIGTGIELTGRRKDGSEFPIEIMLSPLESAGETLVTAAIRDITVRKAAEANLVQKIEELNRSNEELEQFAYVASHDLQEPLRMVASYTQLLSKRYKGKLDSDADEFIAFAVDGANRMQRLIQDLLTFSRVGKRGLELLDISSDRAARQAIVNLRAAIEASGALVTHDLLPQVMADEAQLVQLFQNLVGNAIKYQGPGVPHIHISVAMNGAPKWIFSVADDGLGIESQFFERIFGMFQRLHKRDEFEGTGMGLAICKKIVERHGGVISVESTPGLGSTFQFDLAATSGTL
jgi:PAS domain S-box-containing protein